MFKLWLFIVVAAWLTLPTLSIRAQLITFESTPAGSAPFDGETLSAPYSTTGGSVRFFFDLNGNDTFDVTDSVPEFEARDDNDANPQGFASFKTGGFDRPSAGFLGDWFLRQPGDGSGEFSSLPGPLIIDYDVIQSIDALSGEIWDIDTHPTLGTEQWQIDVLDSSGSVIATQLSPASKLETDPSSLDSLPWTFSFTNLTSISSDADKVRLSFVGTKPEGIGLAFNNFSAFEVLIESADFDEDGDVDGIDFLRWQQGFGADVGSGNIAPHSNGNANYDQFIDSADLSIWEAQYGGPPPIKAATTVPEPATELFALFALCIANRRRWKQTDANLPKRETQTRMATTVGRD